METIITSLFYITVFFNGIPTNLVSCTDGRHELSTVTITRVMKRWFIVKDKIDWKTLFCNYTR